MTTGWTWRQWQQKATEKSAPEARKNKQKNTRRMAGVHPGRLTAGTQTWRFGSDDFPFQLGDF